MKHALAALALIGVIWAFMPERTTPVTPPVASKVGIALRPASKLDRSRVSSFYSAMADVVRRSQAIKTLDGFRRVHASSLDEAFKGTDLPSKYVGLDVAINDELVSAVGLDNVSLDDAKRAALVKALEKVAADAR